MTRHNRISFVANCTLSVALLLTIQAGCGFERLQPPLPELVEGLTLEQLGQIQDDERLTDDEKRDQIREAADIPDTEEGDRLVEFLLNTVVP